MVAENSALAVQEAIPLELRDRPQWVAWTRKHDGGKMPLSPVTGRAAAVNDPETWASFETAYGYAQSHHCGVGFVFTEGDPYCGADFDDCRSEHTGAIRGEVWPMIEALASYAEVSPSGRGVKVIMRSTLDRAHKQAGIELYDRGRFFCITGERVRGTPATIEDRQAEISALIREAFGGNGHRGAEPIPRIIAEGERNNTLTSIGGTLRQRGLAPEAVEAALLAANRAQCRPPLLEAEVLAVVASVSRYEPGEIIPPRLLAGGIGGQEPTAKRPEPPGKAAYYGLAGRVVETADPHTEADPTGVLVHFLIGFGCAVGSGPHFYVGATRHRARLFGALVGETSKARKGDAGQIATRMLTLADPTLRDRLLSGLSSGEGLIWTVRDPIEETKRAKQQDGGYESTTIETDPGIRDKRLFAVEPELARLLRVMSRPGNVLSAVLRDAWDSGDLSIATKNSPAKATAAHICLLGHITLDELRRELADTEGANGFSNRFLWACVKRSKMLPEPEPFTGEDVMRLANEVHTALMKARQVGEMRRDEPARALWRAVYPELSAGRDGLLGAVTARAEAITLRLSMIYALLDGAAVIGVDHLAAALDLWAYCERSAAYIFGDATGDPVADTIDRALRQNGELSRTQISNLFARNESAARISTALQTLLLSGKASVEARGGREGRPAEWWLPI